MMDCLPKSDELAAKYRRSEPMTLLEDAGHAHLSPGALAQGSRCNSGSFEPADNARIASAPLIVSARCGLGKMGRREANRDNSGIVKIANESCQDPIMEIQLDCELESDDCNSRGDQSSDFNSISDWDLHGQRAEEENFIILVDSNEDENILPQLGKTLPCRYQKYKSFQDLTMLQEHRKLHMARNSYRCPLCGKEFFRAANLRMHKLTHTKERPHKCPICNKGFIRTADVWRHLRSFHKIERSSVVLGNANMRNQWCTMKKNQDNKGNPKQLGSATSNLGKESSKPCICPVCHKAFRKPNLLSKHKVIHRQEKPYKCKECGMAFVQLARLKRHNLTHTGERPFSCERCNSTFTRLGSLQRHQRIHTGEKPYSCSYCYVSFTDLGTLKRHEQIHKVIQI
ncbi:uncharacterized protein M6D78_007783 [Vipera latastei]